MIEILGIIIQYLKTKYLRKFKDRRKLEKWQNKQVIKHLKWTMKKSPFYKNYYKEHSIKAWNTLPLIDKKIMMDNFNQLNTKHINKDDAFNIAIKSEISRNFSPKIEDITIGLSSGTSGNRGIFLVSDKERKLWAGTILAKVLPESIFSKKEQKIAFFLRANSNLYSTVNKGKIKFEFFDLFEDINSHIIRLNNYNPTIIVSPPSMLRLLAEEIEKLNLEINPIKVISVAEVLDPIDEAYIEKHFKQKIHQIYQCTEGFLATTCQYGTLHLNEDILIIEKDYIDKDLGKFMPIITDFSRKTQPIIRYRLNDVLTEDNNPCPCGSAFTPIKQIEGRSDDIFYLSSKIKKEKQVIFPDFLRRTVISSSNDILEYKVIQHSLDSIEVIFTTNNSNRRDIENKIEDSLIQLFTHYKCHIPQISFSNQIVSEKGKKLRRIERKFNL